MGTVEFLSKATGKAVDHYVESRRALAGPISTSEAVKAIRAVLPSCEMTDRQLADLVAASAIRRGHDIAFDEAV